MSVTPQTELHSHGGYKRGRCTAELGKIRPLLSVGSGDCQGKGEQEPRLTNGSSQHAEVRCGEK